MARCPLAASASKSAATSPSVRSGPRSALATRREQPEGLAEISRLLGARPHDALGSRHRAADVEEEREARPDAPAVSDGEGAARGEAGCGREGDVVLVLDARERGGESALLADARRLVRARSRASASLFMARTRRRGARARGRWNGYP